jgi:hypothetical protein
LLSLFEAFLFGGSSIVFPRLLFSIWPMSSMDSSWHWLAWSGSCRSPAMQHFPVEVFGDTDPPLWLVLLGLPCFHWLGHFNWFAPHLNMSMLVLRWRQGLSTDSRASTTTKWESKLFDNSPLLLQNISAYFHSFY